MTTSSEPAELAAGRFGSVITSVEELRTHYRPPTRLVAEKKLDHLPAWMRVTIEASRFVFVATADATGAVTVSPRGGSEGFVVVLDERTLALPDYPGNNLTDSLRNIVTNPFAGLIFLVPGRNETIRVDGAAWVVTDATVLDACRRAGGRRPKCAIVVSVRHAFFHCPASFQRADVWNPESWRADAALDFDEFIRRTLDPADWPAWARGETGDG
ncbi:MAG TPA: MSMEG_1061 family FMN-dependent PPOX-type flavoprotein [Acidimicrobiales bacterium]